MQIAKQASKKDLEESKRENMLENFQDIFSSFKNVKDRLKELIERMDKFEKNELIRLKLYYEGLAFPA